MQEKLPEKIFTIGVYGYTEDEFFAALKEHKIDLFIDIRRRRGMRGARYKFVNKTYLQLKLKEIGIAYAHIIGLAPTTKIREIQKKADKEEKVTQRARIKLSEAFKERYRKDILKIAPNNPKKESYAVNLLEDALKNTTHPSDQPFHNIVFFCVETLPEACHRSLVAEELQRARLGVIKEHIKPE